MHHNLSKSFDVLTECTTNKKINKLYYCGAMFIIECSVVSEYNTNQPTINSHNKWSYYYYQHNACANQHTFFLFS